MSAFWISGFEARSSAPRGRGRTPRMTQAPTVRFEGVPPDGSLVFMADWPTISMTTPVACHVTLHIQQFPRASATRVSVPILTFVLPHEVVRLRLTPAGQLRVHDRGGRFRCATTLRAGVWWRVRVRVAPRWTVTAKE